MSIHIEDLTVRFKNGVTAINHSEFKYTEWNFRIIGRKRKQERQL